MADARVFATRLRDAAQGASVAVLTLLHVRLALLVHEAGLEATRLRDVTVTLACALLCGALALVLFVLLVVVAFWDTHRLLAIGATGGALLLAALVLAWRAQRRVEAAPRPFAATIEELSEDVAALRGVEP